MHHTIIDFSCINAKLALNNPVIYLNGSGRGKRKLHEGTIVDDEDESLFLAIEIDQEFPGLVIMVHLE